MKTLFAFIPLFLLVFIRCDIIDEQFIDISGKISDEGAVIQGAVVLLVKGTDISDGLSLTNGSISTAAGKYTIIDVEAGDYYVLAIEDNNNNLEFDSDTDRLGFYGVNPDQQDFLPDELTVDEEDLEDIDIVDLYSLD